MTSYPPGTGLKQSPSTGPDYQQLAKQLAQRIQAREFASDGRLPYERDLAVQCGYSRGTVRAALRILETQGLIQRVRGKGTFVSPSYGGTRWFSTSSTILLAQIYGTTTSFTDPHTYYGRIHAGVRQMAHMLGLAVKVQRVRGYVRVPLAEYKAPSPEEVGGVILSGTFDEQYIRMYQSEGVPVVVVDYWVQDTLADCVAVDVETEARFAVKHLAERGHTSLGFLASGREESNTELRTFDADIPRLLGHLRLAAQQCGMQIRDEWIILASLSSQMYEASRQLLHLRSRPTAAICFNNLGVQALLRALRGTSIRCPEDISIIGRGSDIIDDRQVTSFVSDPEMIGRQAVKLLAERMRGERHHVARLAQGSRLVLGTTTGPAPRPV